jgi:hypothetical protein
MNNHLICLAGLMFSLCLRCLCGEIFCPNLVSFDFVYDRAC